MTFAGTIRQADADDLKAILAIEHECADLAHWSRAAWQDALQDEKERGVTRLVLVAEVAAAVIGFVVVSLVGTVAEIEAAAVAVEARRQGVGRAMGSAAMAWAASRGAVSMQLEVRSANTPALRLYALLGFTEQGSRRAYYRDPVDDAVLMEAALAGRTSTP